MTPLASSRRRENNGTVVLALIALLIAAPLAGCLGDDTDDSDDGLPDEAFRIFVAALGDAGSSQAELGSASVTLAGDENRLLRPIDKTLDLAELAGNGQAVLAAFSENITGDVTETTLSFTSLSVDGTQADGQVIVPLNYTVTSTTEVTVTLNLDETADAGAPVFENLVVEDDGTRVASITRSELNQTPRQEVEPLPEPSIVVRPGADESNDTAPSFEVNDPIALEVTFDEEDVPLREVFWAFGDGSTSSGREVEHTFRTPGFYLVGAIAEGEQGQQARTNTTLDIYWTTDGEGNMNIGTGGSGSVDDRDVKNHTLDIIGNFTSINLRVEDSPSGGLCDTELGTGECAPSNLHIELINPDGEVLAEDTSDADVKWLNLTGLMQGGEWTLRVKGDSGAAFGYTYSAEVHYLGLCASAGGPATVTECPGEPTAEGSDE